MAGMDMAKVVTFIEKEFILNQIQKAGSPVLVFGSGKKLEGSLRSFDKESLCIRATAVGAEQFKSWDSVSVYLAYQGQRVTFPAKVRRVTGADLVLGLPENLFKAPQRKSIRVAPPHDLQLEFYLQNERVRIDCPESNEYSELEMPALSVGFQTDSITSLLDSFRAKSSTMFTRSGIVMFSKERRPESIEERLVSEFGRSLLVPSTQSPLPSTDPYPEGRLITQAMAEAFEGPSVFLEGAELERSRSQKSGEGVVSELYCPILYYQYVIGYIYLMNDEVRRVCLDFRAVDFAWEFSKILAYSLKANNYYRIDESYQPDPYQPRVVNLSATGCLLLMPKSTFSVKLKHGTVLDIHISRSGGSAAVTMTGRVARRFDDKDNDYYGVGFLNAEQDALQALQQSLYADGGESFSCDEAELELGGPHDR